MKTIFQKFSGKIILLRINYLYTTLILSTAILFNTSCQKENVKTIPTLTTLEATNITTTTALSGGTISDDGGSLITGRGICWNKTLNPTITDSKTIDGRGKSRFISSLTGLIPGEKYYARAYAINSIGTAYGTLITFTTTSSLPVITTTEISGITATSATCNVNITSDGGSAVTARGVCWSTSQNPTTSNSRTSNGSGIGSFVCSISGLTQGTTYYLRAYAINGQGTAYGAQVNFSTGLLPVAGFTATPTTIVVGQSVQFTDQSTNATSWLWNFGDGGTSTSINPSHIYSSIGTYTVSLTAYNNLGGNSQTRVNYITVNPLITFNPSLSYGSVADIDGNVYKTILIGTQAWMAENLKTTRYRNGNSIGTTTPSTLNISTESTPKYQWAYNGNESNVTVFGRLYTWYAATDSRNICPTGWHLPSDAEWTTLTTYLGGEDVAGGKLKETGTTNWQSPNSDATNSSGFTALPSGYRHEAGLFNHLGEYGNWLSSTEYSTTNDWYRIMYRSSSYVYRVNIEKTYGFSVRCVRDEPITLPTLTTNAVSGITSTTATIGGTISNDGGAPVIARGVCWSTYQNPTISNSKTTDGSGVGTFTSLLTGLIPGKIYYARAYATNNRVGTAYGNQISFITSVKDTINRKVAFNTYNPAGKDPCLASCIFDLSQWHYFAATISSTYLVKIYVDGQLVDTGYLYNADGSVSTINYHQANWYKLYIGASYVYTFDDFYKGFFDEMRISSCERTSAEISTAYSSRNEFLKDNYTLGLWHFENAITNEVTKAIGSKSGDVDYSQGQWGRCLNFGGVSSSVDCNFSNIPKANVTFEFWVKFNESFGTKNINRCTVIQPYGYLSGNIFIFK